MRLTTRQWRARFRRLEERADDLTNENYHGESAFVCDVAELVRNRVDSRKNSGEEQEIDLTEELLDLVLGYQW